MYKDRSPYLKEVTTEALNFSILYSIVQVAGWILSFITFGLINLVAFIVALVLLHHRHHGGEQAYSGCSDS